MTGYAVAKAGHLNRDGAPVWYGGGKLAADLTIPKLRARWLGTSPGAKPCTRSSIRLTTADQRAIWVGAANAAVRAARTIRLCAVTDPVASADAAWAVSDALHVAANILDSRTLRKAADSYGRAARHGYGRIPRPTPAGTRLRASARLLALSATGVDRDQAAVMVFVTNLAKLTAAVAELRDVQCQAAQVAAARAAAERLHTAAGTTPGRNWVTVAQRAGSSPGRARIAAKLAELDFPDGPKPSAPSQSAVSANSGSRTPFQRPSPTAQIRSVMRCCRHTGDRGVTVKSKIWRDLTSNLTVK